MFTGLFPHVAVTAVTTIALAGELVGAGVLDCSLSVTRQPASELVGVAVVDGGLSVTRSVAGELVSVAVVDGAVTVTRRLAGELVAIAVIDGLLDVSATVDVAAELVALAVVDGGLTVTRGLSAELAALAVLDGSAVISRSLAAELAGLAVVDGGLTVTGSPAGELVAVAALDAGLTVTRRLAGELAALAVVDGRISIAGTVELVAELAALAVLDAVLDPGSVFLDEMHIWLGAGGVIGDGTWYGWKGMLPDSTALPDRAVALLETGGPPQIPNLAIDQPTFDVVVRGARLSQLSTAYPEAETLAYAVRDRFHAVADQPINGVRYVWVQAVEDIAYEGEDEQQRPLFRGRFRALREA